MAITRSLTNGMKVTDWTKEINEIDNMYGFLNEAKVFSEIGTSQNAVIFDKNYVTSELIPQVSRYGDSGVKGKDRQSDIFSLALPYFSHIDRITPSDIQGFRKIGTPDSALDVATAIAIKLEDMRANIDQTKEFMKLAAIQGITVDPSFRVIADMFSEFGLTANNFDVAWDLDNPMFDLNGAIRELKRRVAKNIRAGGRHGVTSMLVTPEFFDSLVSHPNVVEAYALFNGNMANDPLRGDIQRYYNFGIMDRFVHQGMEFLSYEPTFTFPNGQVQRGFGHQGRVIAGRRAESASMGIVHVRGLEDTYRAYYGASNTLSGANQMGQPLFVYQWNDPRDKYIDMELETAPLYVCMKPQVAFRVFNTNALA